MRTGTDIYQEMGAQHNGWHRFKRNRPALIALYILIFTILLALLADILATSQPWYARYRGKSFYPAFRTAFNSQAADSTLNPVTHHYERLIFSSTDWTALPLEKIVWAPIPYSPDYGDPLNRGYVSPGGEQRCNMPYGSMQPCPYSRRHHLGTNELGMDVASGIIHGTRIALRVGFLAMAMAAFIGICIGALGGYYGDHLLRASRGRLIGIGIGILIGFFYAFVYRADALQDAAAESMAEATGTLSISLLVMVFCIFLFDLAGRVLSLLPWLSKRVFVPVDQLSSRSIEVVDSIPRIILIITLASLFHEKSFVLLILIIGLSLWTSIARLVRAEFLRHRTLSYTEAARAMGFRHGRIMFRHILPNAITPVYTFIAFGIADAVLLESALSFLGIGVPPGTATWGAMLSAAREHTDAWWLILYPGLAIFITVTVYNLIGEGLREALGKTGK